MDDNQSLLQQKIDIENQNQYLLRDSDITNQNQYLITAKERNEIIVLKGLEGNSVPELNQMQHFFSQHLIVIQIFWWVIWFTVLVVMVYKLLSGFKQSSKSW